MKEYAVRTINEIGGSLNNIFRLLRKMTMESTDAVGGKCMRGNYGTLYLNEKDRAKLWIAHTSKIMNEENEWDQIVDANAVEGPIESVMREDIMEAWKYLKIGMAPGPIEAYAESIQTIEDAEMRVLMEICRRIPCGKLMSEDWAISVAIPVFRGKVYIIDCGIYSCVKLLEYAMNIAEKALKKEMRKIVTMDDLQFGFLPGKGANDAVFTLWRIQVEYLARRRSCTCAL